MGQKRPLAHEGSSSSVPDPKKPRHGFRVGPDNLPDGPWRRKLTRIKKDLIHKAKVKKAYAKIKARDFPSEQAGADAENGEGAQIHPDRLAMLETQQPGEDAAGEDQDGEVGPESERAARSARTRERRQNRRPGYFDKQLKEAEDKKAAAEARAKEIERRLEEKKSKVAERERHRKAVNKARTAREGGQRKLGRESQLLLAQVKKIMSK